MEASLSTNTVRQDGRAAGISQLTSITLVMPPRPASDQAISVSTSAVEGFEQQNIAPFHRNALYLHRIVLDAKQNPVEMRTFETSVSAHQASLLGGPERPIQYSTAEIPLKGIFEQIKAATPLPSAEPLSPAQADQRPSPVAQLSGLGDGTLPGRSGPGATPARPHLTALPQGRILGFRLAG